MLHNPDMLVSRLNYKSQLSEFVVKAYVVIRLSEGEFNMAPLLMLSNKSRLMPAPGGAPLRTGLYRFNF